MKARRIFAVAASLLLASGCSSTPGPNSSAKDGKTAGLPSPAPVLASKYLAGNAGFTLPDGGSRVAIVAQGPLDIAGAGSSVPLVVRNNTANPVARVEVAGSARGSDGKLVSSGSSQGFVPTVVEPGHISLGFVFFQAELPKDAKFDFDVSSHEPSSPDDPYTALDLDVTEVNQSGRRIVGVVTNTQGRAVKGPLSVLVMCFESDGRVLGEHSAFAEKDELAAEASSPFQVDLFDDRCPDYIVGSHGYSD